MKGLLPLWALVILLSSCGGAVGAAGQASTAGPVATITIACQDSSTACAATAAAALALALYFFSDPLSHRSPAAAAAGTPDPFARPAPASAPSASEVPR